MNQRQEETEIQRGMRAKMEGGDGESEGEGDGGAHRYPERWRIETQREKNKIREIQGGVVRGGAQKLNSSPSFPLFLLRSDLSPHPQVPVALLCPPEGRFLRCF